MDQMPRPRADGERQEDYERRVLESLPFSVVPYFSWHNTIVARTGTPDFDLYPNIHEDDDEEELYRIRARNELAAAPTSAPADIQTPLISHASINSNQDAPQSDHTVSPPMSPTGSESSSVSSLQETNSRKRKFSEVSDRSDDSSIASPQAVKRRVTAAPAKSAPGPVMKIPYHTTTFPPGKDQAGFVPLGQPGTASAAQGNVPNVSHRLKGEIVFAETDAQKKRITRLTYKQVIEKYDAWVGANHNSLRGQVRNMLLPPEQRPRNPQLGPKHVRALKEAVEACTDHKGNIRWIEVKAFVKEKTDGVFGVVKLKDTWTNLGDEEDEDEEEGDEDKEGEDEDGQEKGSRGVKIA